MKILQSITVLISLSFPLFADAQAEDLSAEDREMMDRVSAAYGTQFAQDLTKNGIYLNVDKFAEAFRAVTEGKDAVVDAAEIETAFDEMRLYVLKQRNPFLKENLDYLTENAKKEGIQETESGLQYEVLEEAEGTSPQASDRVRVHYTGKLIDGSVFDSSVERGEPIDFGLSGVIAGWTEGLQLMSEGSKFRFFIPYHLGYGDQGSGGSIPGYATLIFDVELLKINP